MLKNIGFENISLENSYEEKLKSIELKKRQNILLNQINDNEFLNQYSIIYKSLILKKNNIYSLNDKQIELNYEIKKNQAKIPSLNKMFDKIESMENIIQEKEKFYLQQLNKQTIPQHQKQTIQEKLDILSEIKSSVPPQKWIQQSQDNIQEKQISVLITINRIERLPYKYKAIQLFLGFFRETIDYEIKCFYSKIFPTTIDESKQFRQCDPAYFKKFDFFTINNYYIYIEIWCYESSNVSSYSVATSKQWTIAQIFDNQSKLQGGLVKLPFYYLLKEKSNADQNAEIFKLDKDFLTFSYCNLSIFQLNIVNSHAYLSQRLDQQQYENISEFTIPYYHTFDGAINYDQMNKKIDKQANNVLQTQNDASQYELNISKNSNQQLNAKNLGCAQNQSSNQTKYPASELLLDDIYYALPKFIEELPEKIQKQEREKRIGNFQSSKNSVNHHKQSQEEEEYKKYQQWLNFKVITKQYPYDIQHDYWKTNLLLKVNSLHNCQEIAGEGLIFELFVFGPEGIIIEEQTDQLYRFQEDTIFNVLDTEIFQLNQEFIFQLNLDWLLYCSKHFKSKFFVMIIFYLLRENSLKKYQIRLNQNTRKVVFGWLAHELIVDKKYNLGEFTQQLIGEEIPSLNQALNLNFNDLKKINTILHYELLLK